MPDPMTPTQALVARVRDALECSAEDFDCENGVHRIATADLRQLCALVEAREGDAARLTRLIDVLGLRVVRDEPSNMTCCLQFPNGDAFIRSHTNDVREFIDIFARFDAARGGSDVR